MHRLNYVICFLLFIAPSVASPQVSSEGTNRVCQINKSAPADTNLVLNRITIDRSQAVFDFTFNGPGWVRLYKPGSPHALFVESKSSGKRYDIIDASGVSWAPDKTQVSKGQSVRFKVIFEKIDAEDQEIDLIEGDEKVSGKVTSIPNIRLE
jgi:hypothetical protein